MSARSVPMHLTRRRGTTADPDLVRELAALTRQHQGIVHQRRMEHLADELRERWGGLAVRQSWSGFSGDRMRLHLDDGQVLELSLLWPRRTTVIAIVSVRWAPQVGWEVRARDASGRDVRLYAWRARVLPA